MSSGPRAFWALLATWVGCADDPSAVFARDVAPVLEQRCANAACHGISPGEGVPDGMVDVFALDADGHLQDVEAARLTALRYVNTKEDPVFSSLLRKPLARAEGGLPHRGGENFPSTSDPACQAIADWILLEPEGGEDPAPLSPTEEAFAQGLQPALLAMGCAAGSCHGLDAAVPFRLDPGVAAQVSIAGTRHNHTQVLSMLALDGDPAQSRLLRKALPLWDGGIVHKGGNDSFLADRLDPRVPLFLDQACAEREAATGAPCLAPGEAPIRGFVFVRGPLGPHDPFDLDVWEPGSDLWFAEVADPSLAPVSLTNLTASLHPGPADLRDPAVDPTGRWLLFAMRRDPGLGHALWSLDLQTGEAVQLTPEGGPLPGGGIATDRDPTWVPGGVVWFTSTRAGELNEAGSALDAELWEIPTDGTPRRRSWTPHAERRPRWLRSGAENGGEIAFTALRDAVPGQRRAHPFRFPPSLETEYHQHFGITPPETLFFDLGELPDGRYTTSIGELPALWEGGRAAIIDRNFGPEIPAGLDEDDAAIPFYAPPLARLDDQSSSGGVTGRLWLDLAGLPDGSLLAAVADGPLDLTDPEAGPDLRIERVWLEEDLRGEGPALGDRQVIVDEIGVADHDPVPVGIFWEGPPAGEMPVPAEPGRATFLHNGLPMIDALLERLAPVGAREPDAPFVAVRLLEALRPSPSQRRPIPADETRWGELGATTAGLGAQGPSRILAELPLAADGSFHVNLPAGLAVRLQGLDALGMARGTPHNRWYDLAPGQRLRQGVPHGNPLVYGAQCAACHGARDGDPDHTFDPPDVMTTATLTLARFQDGDPRRPLAPARLGDETRVTLDFRQDIRPILDRSCTEGGCHDGQGGDGLDLRGESTAHFDVGYEELLRPGFRSGGGRDLVDRDGTAWRSHLIERLRGVEQGAPGSLKHSGPHPDGGLLPAEFQTLIRWIDLGAPWSVRPLEDR